MHVVLGTGEQETYRPADFAAFYRRARDAPRGRGRRAARHVPVAGRALRDLRASSQLCRDRWARRRPPAARRLHPPRPDRAAERGRDHDARGARRDARRHGRPAHGAARRFETLRHQASLQLAAAHGPHRYELLEPAERRGLGLLPAAVAGRPLLRHRGRPFVGAGARARVPARHHRRRAAASPRSGRTIATRSGARSRR